ncbi:hypothetical protein KCTC52924_02440 [Arenibacter antarcticus]|uniref:Dabb family protein n=1 Tax=Arenibacter antarcticus TaxID=2040469 RepID=A0ABW5VJT0_9FLAO|nr:Dabb family protein [Arenibacter sp. H213]MCM4168748.1 stress responsive alpha-beta barrel domain-containing protein [Arenibacter sp. H213]
MKAFITLSTLIISITLMSFNSSKLINQSDIPLMKTLVHKDSLLRHVVLFKFKEGTSKKDIAKVEAAFSALPTKIPQIVGYEWGLNNSPEGLDKGFTHCFFLTFNSEKDRAIYLPHPDHKAFGAILSPHLDDVTVVDYWTK